MLNFKTNTIKNICIIGLMGSGKSVIGKNLSQIYSIDFFDTDHEIEKESGKSIENLFSNFGEDYFRKIEENICLKFLKKRNCVISLGGGSIINKKVREVIKKNSYSIYLKVDIEILLERLKKSKKRPLLNNVDREKILEDLYKKRNQFYNEADLIIKNNLGKKEIITEIKNTINNI